MLKTLRLSAAALVCVFCTPAWALRPLVIIDPGGAPPEVLQSITDAVDAITLLAEDQDVREVARLRRRAWDAAQAALQTQGYFAAKVDLDVSEAEGDQPEFWDISIDTGQRTKVQHLGLDFSGAIMQPAYSHRRQQLYDDWLLKPGMPFINDQWSSAKDSLLDQVRSQDFYFASYAKTQALIHPDAAQADLDLVVKSGPAVKMGELQVIGLKRVPESLVRQYVRYEPGQAYNQELLDDWQQSLQSTDFFRGAFVTLDDGTAPAPESPLEDNATVAPRSSLQRHDMDASEPVTLPVRVQLTEGLARSFKGSLGVDSDHGVRAEGLYHQNVVFGKAVALETGAGIDKDNQRLFFDLHLPPNNDASKDSLGILYDHSDIQGLETHMAGLGWKRSQNRKGAGNSRVEYEVHWGGQLSYEKNRISDSDNYEVPSVVASWQWLRRDVNSKYDPREGNLLEVGLGVGMNIKNRQPFYRTSLRAQQWWSFSERDIVSLRGQVGKVWTHTDKLPQEFLWRTGGSRTIRGYRYNSIGVKDGSATVGAPALGIVSLEYTRYFTDIFGANVFVDAGDAAASFKDFQWHLGYGAGVVANTPAGPFYVDLAWAQKDRRVRLVFSIGIAF